MGASRGREMEDQLQLWRWKFSTAPEILDWGGRLFGET